MGKQPVKLKAVVYALSPFQQKVMPGLWKDLPGKIHHKVSENWISECTSKYLFILFSFA
ncbi:cytochrome b-c1 complex subunit 8-like [Lycium barbarum]|uniref:cytochrome b-c1 complex subunit 8-like n=1 Tax=Lycium ferocissimum TaxID=112874 RepID=UPI002815C025|nr:cytochrome b-c1 complex subunit 8-like [Lycium ferocissimum]XP_060174974.1 cytochrome b-c1 complex subunit 8-like [Lycium barbarum]